MKWRWDTNSVDVFPITLGKNREKTKDWVNWRVPYVLPLNIQLSREGLKYHNWFNPAACVCLFQALTLITTSYVVVFLCSVRSERWFFVLLILVTITIWIFFIINIRCTFCTYSLPLTKTTCYHKLNDNINMYSTVARSMNASN